MRATRHRRHRSVARPSVLIVEHDADTRALYRTAFSSLNYEVEESSDGAEALGKALCRHPDVIVTETQLPRINGIDLCRVLRSDPQTRAVPIVVVTGTPGAGTSARAISAGANLVLIKPCDLSAVVSAAKTVVKQSHGDADSGVSTELSSAEASAEETSSIGGRPQCKSRRFQRYVTAAPPTAPPELRCPVCDALLLYEHSHIGGVNVGESEQWDRFVCSTCGPYQYRHRTRKLGPAP